jgi:arsenate reductase
MRSIDIVASMHAYYWLQANNFNRRNAAGENGPQGEGCHRMITVYGLKNCDTCRKAMKWLDQAGKEAVLHDFRKDGLDAERLGNWLDRVDWEVLLNKRGTTWRKLDAADKENVDRGKAEALMLAQPSLIKRPVIELGDRVLVGFGDAEREVLIAD